MHLFLKSSIFFSMFAVPQLALAESCGPNPACLAAVAGCSVGHMEILREVRRDNGGSEVYLTEDQKRFLRKVPYAFSEEALAKVRVRYDSRNIPAAGFTDGSYFVIYLKSGAGNHVNGSMLLAHEMRHIEQALRRTDWVRDYCVAWYHGGGYEGSALEEEARRVADAFDFHARGNALCSFGATRGGRQVSYSEDCSGRTGKHTVEMRVWEWQCRPEDTFVYPLWKPVTIETKTTTINCGRHSET